MFRRQFLTVAATAALGSGPARAQTYASRPIRVVLPFSPGSAGDGIPRVLAQRVQSSIGQPLVIDNRPGAAGIIATDLVAKSAPDGYTLLSHAVTFAITPHLVKAPYDALRDLVPITQTVSGSYVLVVQPSFPASTLGEWVSHVRQNPGRFNYASYGSGSGPHLAMEMLKQQAGLFIVHVPFRGAAPAMQELLAGRVEMAFDTTVAALPHIRAGKLKAIAVGGLRTVAALPGIPTIASVFSGFDSDGWQGLFAPVGTPPDIVSRLEKEFVLAARNPEFARQMQDLGFSVVASSAQDFAAFVKSEYQKFGKLIRERRIQAD